MARLISAELFELDLPFRRPFRHAAAERSSSASLFLRCVSDSGHEGFGETLPRAYVTGETQEGCFELLAEKILPRLLEMEFASLDEVFDFLEECDGVAPPGWVHPDLPQSAAWCAVDLALLDTFGAAFSVNVAEALSRRAGSTGPWPGELRYAGVVSAGSPSRALRTLLRARVYGLRDVKVKAGAHLLETVRLARRVLGRGATIRVDANMGWTPAEARGCMKRLAAHGVAAFEQPIAADDLAGMAALAAAGDGAVMADESFADADSLEALIEAEACAAVNVRIAKCGGLVAALRRCRRALAAGLTLQVGCQVGETSLLSAAQLALVRAVGDGVRYVEGCFGERLLRLDPVSPVLRFSRGGVPPEPPSLPGFGMAVRMDVVSRFAGRRIVIGSNATSEPGRFA